MGLGYLLVLSALLVTRATARCSQEDCETGISAGIGAASACSAIGGIACAFTFGIGCVVAGVCGAAAGVADGVKGACRACGDGGVGAGAVAERLSNQIKNLSLSVEQLFDQSIKIEGQIQLTHIIALYGQDIINYQKVRRAFKGLRKNSKGLITRNIDATRFEESANHAIYGLAASSVQIFQMMTGGHPLKAKSIFQAVPDFCKNGAKDYFVKVMIDCYLLESISRAMTGESMSPARVLSFKKQLILIEDQFIKDCGCPDGLAKTARRSNLQSSLVSLARSQPLGHCSSNETYADQPVSTFIMDDSTDHHTLKKISLLYSAAPFSPAKSAVAKCIAETYSFEELKLAQYLSTSHSLMDLELYKGHLFCAKKECCNTLRMTGGVGGQYTKTNQVYNNRAVYENKHGGCIWYQHGEWRNIGCYWFKDGDFANKLHGHYFSPADTVCPESTGRTWGRKGLFAVDTNISVECLRCF